jgi:DNA-binding PadR family transcriptional regulator
VFGKNLEVTPTEALFLLVLQNQSDLSGTEIVSMVKNELGKEWSPTPGATYKIIKNLLDKGYIDDTTNKDEENRDERIKTYSLTADGRNIVIKIVARMQKVVGFLDTCCPDGSGRIVIVNKSESDDNDSSRKN